MLVVLKGPKWALFQKSCFKSSFRKKIKFVYANMADLSYEVFQNYKFYNYVRYCILSFMPDESIDRKQELLYLSERLKAL